MVLPEYRFVAVWPRHAVGDKVDKFLAFGKSRLNARLHFLEDAFVSDGDFDVIFAVHRNDILPWWYASPRFSMVRIEEALRLHPERYDAELHRYRNY